MVCPLEEIIEWMNNSEKYYFFIGTVILYASAFPVTDILCRAFSEKFKASDHDRQYYIISNVLKSFMLIFVANMFLYILLTGTLHPFRNEGFQELHIFLVNLSSIYCVTDIVSLILNYRAQQWSTRFHHIAVAVACWRIYTADFTGEGIYKGMMMYGAYSSLAAPVNTYLGARFLLEDAHTKILKGVAYYSYIFSCFLNWSWQAYYMFYLAYIGLSTENYAILFKIGFMGTMIYTWMKDDFILIAHLKK